MFGTTRKHDRAIEAAMTAAAPDGGSWLSGKQTFERIMRDGGNVTDALDEALKAAAPDGGSYLHGEQVFWDSMEAQTLRGRLVAGVEWVKAKVGMTGQTEIH